MRTLAAVALVAASATAASAEAYLGLGIGTTASVGGDMTSFQGDGSRSGRLILGSRFGRFSVEGNGTRFGLIGNSVAYQADQLAAALKYSFPLGNNFEVFGRGGLERTWLSTDAMTRQNFAGNGYLLGAGFEYRLDLAVAAGSIFVDYTRTATGFSGDSADASRMPTLDGTASMWTLGLTLSI
jgi:hypothetical protein